MNEKWTGHYVYGEGYPDNLYGQAVQFDIEWTNSSGVGFVFLSGYKPFIR